MSGRAVWRPGAVLGWARETFGPIALNRVERAARCVEEAIEIAQCEGLPLAKVKQIADRVYSRPPGLLAQEIGGLMISTEALAENVNLSAEAEAAREFERITALPADHHRRRQDEKARAGVALQSNASD